MRLRMTLAVVLLSSVFIAFAIIQLVIIAALIVAWGRTAAQALGHYSPRAAVIVALRGADPFLADFLVALVCQDYPDYKVFVIVDHEADPAAAVVSEAQSAAPRRLVTDVLREPLASCGLKCSAQIQALRALDPSFGVVAFIDADAPPHPMWLREMVAPLADVRVGATTGVRWYAPLSPGWGAVSRYVWNVGAVAQLWLNRCAWGGSMAMRVDTIRAVGLIDALAECLADDFTVTRQVHRHRLEIRLVPRAIMVNQESVGLAAFRRWVDRQVLMMRLGENGWPLVALQSILMFPGQLAAVAVIVAAVSVGAWGLAAWCAGALLAYWTSMVVCVVAQERFIRRTLLKARGKILPPNPALGWRLLPTLALLQLVHPLACARAARRRTISWRGITYGIGSDGRIYMQRYRPYTPPAGDAPAGASVL